MTTGQIARYRALMVRLLEGFNPVFSYPLVQFDLS
jgi:hypothetical protein